MMAPELPKLGGQTVRAKVETPSESELFKTGGADLDAARDSGVDYSIPHAVNLSNTAEQAIYNQGIGPADAPRTFAKLAEARDVPPDAVSMPINGLMGGTKGISPSSLQTSRRATWRQGCGCHRPGPLSRIP